MSIHYENYKAFSKGQGFIGSACRPLGGPMATTLRWFACDCPKCKLTLLGKRVINRDGVTGRIEQVSSLHVIVLREGTGALLVSYRDLDANWAPLDLDEIFGMEARP